MSSIGTSNPLGGESVSFSQSLDRLKESFLWAAAQGGNLHDIDSLIEIGADINWQGPEGDVPLLAAARKGHVDAVSLLLANGAHVNHIGSDGYTALHIAVKRGDYEMTQLLLNDSNINIKIKNKEGLNALDIAKSKGNEEIYNILINNNSSKKFNKSNNNDSKINILNITELPSNRRNLPSISPRGVGGIVNENESNIANIQSNSSVLTIKKATTETVIPSSVTHKSTHSYKLQGTNDMSTVIQPSTKTDETSIALQKLLENEIRSRQISENKLTMLQEQHLILSESHLLLQKEFNDMKKERDKLVHSLHLLQGDAKTIEKLTTIDQCDELERQLKATLDVVDNRKQQIVKLDIDHQKEQRLCVVCCEKDKSVVLLPCRHMCLCEDCSLHDQLEQCPLCRRDIAHRISVYN